MHLMIQFRRAWCYLIFVTILHLVTLATFYMYFERWWLVVFMGLTLLSYNHFIYTQYFHCISGLNIQPDDQVTLIFRNTSYQQAQLEKVAFASKFCLILVWKTAAQRYHQTVWRDMCSQTAYHQLFLWANWLCSKYYEKKQ